MKMMTTMTVVKMMMISRSANDKVVIILLMNKVNAKSNAFMNSDFQRLVNASQLGKQPKFVENVVSIQTKDAEDKKDLEHQDIKT